MLYVTSDSAGEVHVFSGSDHKTGWLRSIWTGRHTKNTLCSFRCAKNSAVPLSKIIGQPILKAFAYISGEEPKCWE
jgi:hypothetical protein